MPDTQDIEIVKLQMRADALEREVRSIKDAIKEISEDLGSVATELKLAVQELRNAVKQPTEKMALGWRIIAGIGTIAITLIMGIGGLIGIVDHFSKHH